MYIICMHSCLYSLNTFVRSDEEEETKREEKRGKWRQIKEERMKERKKEGKTKKKKRRSIEKECRKDRKKRKSITIPGNLVTRIEGKIEAAPAIVCLSSGQVT